MVGHKFCRQGLASNFGIDNIQSPLEPDDLIMLLQPSHLFVLLCERWKQRSYCGGSDGYVSGLPQFICHSKIYSSTNLFQI